MRLLTVSFGLCLLLLAPAFGLDASDLSEYVGYFILENTRVDGSFEGAEYGDPVKLENGMIFEFQEYNYSYSYYPETIILISPWPDSVVQDWRTRGYRDWQLASYALIIDDDIYDVIRLK